MACLDGWALAHRTRERAVPPLPLSFQPPPYRTTRTMARTGPAPSPRFSWAGALASVLSRAAMG